MVVTTESEWKARYDNIMQDIANSKSMDERSHKVNYYNYELSTMRDSGLPVDNDLAYLGIGIQANTVQSNNAPVVNTGNSSTAQMVQHSQIISSQATADLDSNSNVLPEAAWRARYDNIMLDIAKSGSMDERREKANYYKKELESMRDSGLNVNNDLAYLGLPVVVEGKDLKQILKQATADILPNVNIVGAVLEKFIPSQPPPISEMDWLPKFQNSFTAEVIIGGYKKVNATVSNGWDSVTENIHFKKDFEEDGKKYKYQLDVGGYRARISDESAKQDERLRGKRNDFGYAMSELLPLVGNGGLGKGIGVARKVVSGIEKLANGAIEAESLAQKLGVEKVALNNKELSKVAEGFAKAELSNPLPASGKFATTMPREYAEQILANSGGKLSRGGEAWITAAEDLKGINTIEGTAKRLTLVDESSALRLKNDAVLEFNLRDTSGIYSPLNRTNPGFINGGRTGGEAREWLIPSDKEIWDISIRYLE